MDKKKLLNLYNKMKYDSKVTDAAVRAVQELENYLKK